MFAGLMTAFLLSPAFGQLPSRGPSPEMKRACTVSLEPRAPKLRVIRPAPSDAILFNPGMGLYLAGNERMYTKPPADAWCLSIADIVYYRFFWSDLEPDGPRDSYDEFFAPIFDFWVKQRGKRVAFRVMSEASHFPGMYCTPKWVFDQGVPGVEHRGVHGQRQIDPVFWDERYLRIYGQFVERLGRYLDGRPGVEWVEIGGIGEWGEMHLGLHIPGRWTTEQLEQTGYTLEKYIAAYRRVIDAHARAFPRTRVFLNVGKYAQINDYAALRGLQLGHLCSIPTGDVAHQRRVGRRGEASDGGRTD